MKMVTLSSVLLVSWAISVVLCNIYTKNGQKCVKDEHGDEHCYDDDGFDEDNEEKHMSYDEETNTNERESLFIWDPVEVGYEREIEIEPGETITIVTKAIRPKVFQIENFLTDEEADHIIEKGKLGGISGRSSGLKIDTKKKTDLQKKTDLKDLLASRSIWDNDGDGEITMDEVIKTAKLRVRLYLNASDVEEIFRQLGMDEMDDGVITVDEFEQMNTASLSDYMNDLKNTHPRFRARFSETVWLNASDKIMYNLREKVIKLTNLPRYIIEGSEKLQVVRYEPYGHYHAHFDGQDPEKYPDKTCCYLDRGNPDCRLCRFITIIYYLNDVPGGGQTAFPVADQKDYVEKEIRRRALYNLSEFCYNASLAVTPKKGRAVMFYNHFLDDKGWLGALDRYSLHGGCDVTEGIKWLANNWIGAPPAKYAHLVSPMYKP